MTYQDTTFITSQSVSQSVRFDSSVTEKWQPEERRVLGGLAERKQILTPNRSGSSISTYIHTFSRVMESVIGTIVSGRTVIIVHCLSIQWVMMIVVFGWCKCQILNGKACHIKGADWLSTSGFWLFFNNEFLEIQWPRTKFEQNKL